MHPLANLLIPKLGLVTPLALPRSAEHQHKGDGYVLLGFASLRRMFTGLDGWLLEPIER
jgi:hypothetical protein